MNKDSVIAIIRIVAPLIVTLLGALGITLDVDTVVCIAIVIVGGALAIYTGWKNNNVTSAAQKAQEYLNEIKQSEKVENESVE